MPKLILMLMFPVVLFAQVNFNEFFEPKTLRVDYVHFGTKDADDYAFTGLREEPFWGGPRTNMLDPFNYGKYRLEVRDSASGKLIYTKNYATLFSEWQTTAEAKVLRKGFPESVVMPYPKNKVVVSFHTRDKNYDFHKKLEFTVDPASYFITKERRHVYPNFQVHNSGDPAHKVDIVIIPEGYTAAEMDKFREDCARFSGYLFRSSPYKENKNNFNIWGVLAPSAESGTDVPANGTWVKTNCNTSFYTFDIERYCMTEDYTSVRDLAANAPYDQIYLLVNTSKYGGGAIYNFYSICVNNNKYEEYIFVHEFGHGFASLADEYYESSTAYEDFYPLDKEPLDPNLTTLKDFGSKWKSLVDASTPVPTPADEKYRGKVGAFEGGGYVAKNIYRPRYDCTMKSISVDNFCPVCKNAIEKMIRYYTD